MYKQIDWYKLDRFQTFGGVRDGLLPVRTNSIPTTKLS